jgi:hypothetical protein
MTIPQHYEIASPEDLTKVLRLLQEYTTKLREICDEQASFRFRRLQLSSWFSGILSGAAALVAWLLSSRGDFIKSVPIAIAITGLLTAAIGAAYATFTASSYDRSRRIHDGYQLAKTVEQLVKVISQYREHASYRLGDILEFDLRLSEAEAALRTFRTVAPGVVAA